MILEMANRLTQLRRNQEMSQEMLAEKLGVSRQAISKWERGEACPDIDNLIMLADLYGVTMDDLIRGTVSQPQPRSALSVVQEEQEPEPDLGKQEEEEKASQWEPGSTVRRRTSRVWLMANPFTNLGVSVLFGLAWLGMIAFVILVGAHPFQFDYYSSDPFFVVNDSFRMGNYIGCIFLLPWLFRMLYGAFGKIRLYQEYASTAEKFFRAFPYALLMMIVNVFGLTYGHSGWWLFYLTIPMYEWIADSVFGDGNRYRIAVSFPVSSVLLCASCFLSMVWGTWLPYFLLIGVPVYYGIVALIWAVKKNKPVAWAVNPMP